MRVENNIARIVSSADLTLAGTYDRPLLFGHATIERGELFFEGNRYLVTRGSIDFANPTKIEPFFDIEAETRACARSDVPRHGQRLRHGRQDDPEPDVGSAVA